LFSVFACTLFFVLLTRRPWVRSLLLLASAIAWVLAANVARVVLVAYSTTRWGFDLTESGRHETLGLFLFGLALLLIASTDQLLAFLLVPAGGPAARGRNAVFDATTEASADSSSGQPRRWLVAWPFTVAFAALLAVHVASYGVASDAATLTGVPVAAAVEGLGEDSFPNELAGWKQQGFKIEQRSAGSSFGECSREWTYMRGGNLAVISLDYPFPGWHDLTRCYTGQGWAMDEEVIRQARTDGETLGEAFVAVRLTKPGYRSGYLLFWQCDPSGTPLEARRGAAYLAAYRHASLWRRWLDRAQGRPAPPALPSTVYQCQLFLETNAPPTPVEQAEVEQLFLEAVKALRRSWQPDPSPPQQTSIPAENHNQ
jgi:exosortase/archaeosortase family protein